MNNTKSGGMNALTRGVVIFVVLAVLTVIEYIIGTHEAPTFVMLALGLVKAALVVWYFMHLRRVFNPDEGDH